MKIIKYKKKGNKYIVELSNKEIINLYGDTIIYFDLLRKKEISNIDEAAKYDKGIEAYYKSVSYLNRKMRTTRELREYLDDYPSKVIDSTIVRLTKEGYLNDKHYLEVYVRSQINTSSNGPYKIQRNLINIGFNKEDIEEELRKYNNEIFRDKISNIIDKKIKSNKKYSVNKIREKIIIDLYNNGYDKNEVIDVLNNTKIEVSKDIINKEYDKIFRVLSKKYEGYDLKKRIVNKLVGKGFGYEEAKDLVFNKE